MLGYVARRVASLVAVLLASTVLVFVLLHLAPGDPATVLLGGRPATAAELQSIRDKYDLEKPLPVQYAAWLGRVGHGDLGESVAARDTVAHVVGPRLGTTLLLTLYAMILILVIGIPLGIASGVFRSGFFDLASTFGSLAFASVPAYVMGLVLLVLFGVELHWFPTLGGGEGGLGDRLYHLTLPAISLALSSMALVSRVTRSAVVAELASEHVDAARIRGFSERRVVVKHALRGALIPVLTVSGVVFGYLLAGAILVEYTFGISGIGSLLVSAVQGKDFAVVQAIALIVTAEFLVLSLVVDLLYGVVDPRVKLAGAGGSVS
jgi:peptide/nickel transport system permease protein